jgi:hypothetical protein
LTLHQANLLDATVVHGDGTTTAAKKGGDNIGFSGHRKVKSDKIVAFCDRNCNVIAPTRRRSPQSGGGDCCRQRALVHGYAYAAS